MAKQKWGEMSPRRRKLIIAGGVGEACLKAAMLIDIKRRRASQIRGSKWLWRPLALVNFFGPVSYFAFGRRWHTES
jgi:hypothetical protein